MKKGKLLLILALGLTLGACAGSTGATGATGPQGEQGEKGEPGATPTIGENGNWWIDGSDTGLPSTGENGLTPTIGENGNWWIGDEDTNVKAEGKDGETPYIGENGNWWIGETDTLINARSEVYTVTFNSNGGSNVASQEVAHGEKITKPNNPTNGTKVFLGWSYNDELWSFEGHVVTCDMELVALWSSTDSMFKAADYYLNQVNSIKYLKTSYGNTSEYNYEWGQNENGLTYYEKGPYETKYYAYDENNIPYGYTLNNNKVSKWGGELTASSFDGPSVYFLGSSHYGLKGLLNAVESSIALNNNATFYGDENSLYVENAVTSYGSTTLYQMKVEFDYCYGLLNSITVETRSVYSNQLVQDFELGIWYVSETATLSDFDVHKFELNYGERTLELPYEMDDFYYDSFELVNNKNEALSEVSVEKGASTSLNLKNGSPATANYSFDTPKVEILPGASGSAIVSFNQYNGKLSITGENVGEVNVKVTTKNVTKEIKIIITTPKVASISMYSYTAPTYENGPYGSSIANKPLLLYIGQELILGAQVSPSAALQDYVLSSEASELVIEKLPEKIKTNSSTYDSIYVDAYKVSCDVVGTYEVKTASVEDSSITSTCTIEVKEAPTVEDIVVNDYWFYTGGRGRPITVYYYLEFTPNENDLSTGSFVFEDFETSIATGGDPIIYEGTYAFDASTNIFTLKDESGELHGFELEVNSTFNGIIIRDTNLDDGTLYMNGFTLSKYSVDVYIQFEWYAGPSFNYSCILLSSEGKANWDGNSITYTATENNDGSITITIDSTSLETMCEELGVDSITSLIIDNTYSTLTLTYVDGGITKTEIFSK